MAQEAKKENVEFVRPPLTPEQAKQIAKKSYERLIAQRAQHQKTNIPESAKNLTQKPVEKGINNVSNMPVIRRPAVQMQKVNIPSSDNRVSDQIKTEINVSVSGVHRTKNGAPDRRFVENQHLTAREAEIEKAKFILQQATISVKK